MREQVQLHYIFAMLQVLLSEQVTTVICTSREHVLRQEVQSTDVLMMAADITDKADVNKHLSGNNK